MHRQSKFKAHFKQNFFTENDKVYTTLIKAIANVPCKNQSILVIGMLKDPVGYILGARNGDIFKQVNGMPLNETEKMLELWSNIKNSTNITIDIDRKGKCFTYEFTKEN